MNSGQVVCLIPFVLRVLSYRLIRRSKNLHVIGHCRQRT